MFDQLQEMSFAGVFDQLQEMDDEVEPLRAEIRVLRQQLGKAPVPVKPQAAAGNVSSSAAADNQSVS